MMVLRRRHCCRFFSFFSFCFVLFVCLLIGAPVFVVRLECVLDEAGLCPHHSAFAFCWKYLIYFHFDIFRLSFKDWDRSTFFHSSFDFISNLTVQITWFLHFDRASCLLFSSRAPFSSCLRCCCFLSRIFYSSQFKCSVCVCVLFSFQ